jgi:hypothetical protein
MSRRLILGLAAATLVGVMLAPLDARAHYRTHPYPYGPAVCSAADFRGWNPFSRDPGQEGAPGNHYRCDCYRAANGRTMCPAL